MIIINDIDQGSEEWLDLRCRIPTASRFKDVMAKGQGKTRHTYMLELAVGIITGKPYQGYKSDDMEWGNEHEDQARSMYEVNNNVIVEQIAFIMTDDRKAGVSVDSTVGDKGLLEIKCPKTITQLRRYLEGKFPKEYNAQIQGQLSVSEREWCDFVSFDPRIIGRDSSWFQVRVYRDEEYIEELTKELAKFNNELVEMVDRL